MTNRELEAAINRIAVQISQSNTICPAPFGLDCPYRNGGVTCNECIRRYLIVGDHRSKLEAAPE